MKKAIIIILLLSVSLFNVPNFSCTIHAQRTLTADKVLSDIDTIHNSMDSTFYYGKQLGTLLSDEVKTYGLKKTIQINHNLFVPAFIFLVLFLLYLKGRRN